MTDLQKEHCKAVDRAAYKNDFRECNTCAAKSGTPELCTGCFHNRELITRLQKESSLTIARIAHRKIIAQLCYALNLILTIMEKSARESYAATTETWEDDWFREDSDEYLTFSHARMVWNNFIEKRD